MDKRKSYFLTIDTETANGFDDPIVYDIGGCIHDKEGNVMETFSFVIYETFFGMRELMETAYYAKKIPQYLEDISNGKRKVVRYSTAKKYIRQLCEKYSVKAIIAHNMRFDYRATTRTQRYLTKSKYRFFLPYGVELWDTLKMARDTIGKSKTYIHFCEENDFLTKYGKPRLTAEVLYRYIVRKTDFIESHTGLEDTLIEKEIFVKCISYHKKMTKTLWKN